MRARPAHLPKSGGRCRQPTSQNPPSLAGPNTTSCRPSRRKPRDMAAVIPGCRRRPAPPAPAGKQPAPAASARQDRPRLAALPPAKRSAARSGVSASVIPTPRRGRAGAGSAPASPLKAQRRYVADVACQPPLAGAEAWEPYKQHEGAADHRPHRLAAVVPAQAGTHFSTARVGNGGYRLSPVRHGGVIIHKSARFCSGGTPAKYSARHRDCAATGAHSRPPIAPSRGQHRRPDRLSRLRPRRRAMSTSSISGNRGEAADRVVKRGGGSAAPGRHRAAPARGSAKRRCVRAAAPPVPDHQAPARNTRRGQMRRGCDKALDRILPAR